MCAEIFATAVCITTLAISLAGFIALFKMRALGSVATTSHTLEGVVTIVLEILGRVQAN